MARSYAKAIREVTEKRDGKKAGFARKAAESNFLILADWMEIRHKCFLSLDALVAIALAQSLSRLIPDSQLEERGSRATGKGFIKFSKQIPAAPPPERDRLPDGYKPKQQG